MKIFSGSFLLIFTTTTTTTTIYGLRNRMSPVTHSGSRQLDTRIKMGFDPLGFSVTTFSAETLQQLGNIFHTGAHTAAAATSLAPMDVASSIIKAGEESANLNLLGNDLLIFFFTTIFIVPLFQYLKASPVLGFLAAGTLMGPAGLHLFTDLNDMEALADFGVLFLLFEQGLELTVDRLKALKQYAFGMGVWQVLLSTAAFSLFPFLGGVRFLEFFVRSNAALVDITRIDEAVVIGAALSLSSSAFVLKVLQEKNQLGTKFGAACLGILLLQDIAVVPLLVLLPILEDSSGGAVSFAAQAILVGGVFIKAFLGLGAILFIGGKVVRFLFSLVAQTKSSETFVALCLLVALGTGALTDRIGLSSTLGAFTAGTLLAESNYRTQIESDLKPFRGLLLGLFFLTTGATVEPSVIQNELPTVLALLAGLVGFKAVITTAIGPSYGLTWAESARTGLLLSGGGEFAFVVLTLAGKLEVLPDELVKILVGVVVLSMAMTPYLSSLGDFAAEKIEKWEKKRSPATVSIIPAETFEEEDLDDAVVVCGFGPAGETVARLMQSEDIEVTALGKLGSKYMAFDLDPNIVINKRKAGLNVMYGDGSLPNVLETAGISHPKAVVVTYEDEEVRFGAVQRLREAFPQSLIISRAYREEERVELLKAGASVLSCDERESGLRMAGSLLASLGVDRTAVSRLCREDREESEKEDIKVLEQSRQMKVDNSGSFTSYSSMRFNSADNKNDLAKNFLDLAKNKFAQLMWSDKLTNVKKADDVEEDSIGEPIYASADQTVTFREVKIPEKDKSTPPLVGGAPIPPIFPPGSSSDTISTLDGIDGVDFCLLPERTSGVTTTTTTSSSSTSPSK